MSQTSSNNFSPETTYKCSQFSGNPEQETAYYSTGNCVVLAGPGSGKTYTLTHKIARTLKEDIRPPRRIACITYNKQCVRAFKRQLKPLGITDSKSVFIGTVHSFCLKNIILPFASLVDIGIPIPFKVGSEREIKILQQQAFDNSGVNNHWSWHTDSYRRIYIDRDSDTWRGKDEESANIIEEFERLLLANGFVDFDWMILTGLQMVQRFNWIRKALAAQFPVIFVDEYQDLGVALHEMIKILCLQGGIRIVAVGDPDQSIYGFSGANPELIKELSLLPGFETIQLKMNYRCGNVIIQASEIALGESRGCTSHSGEQGAVFFHHILPALADQARQVCEKIIPDILGRNQNIAIGDIGIFYIDKNDGDVIAQKVSEQEWDYIRVDGNSPYKPSPITYWLEECAAWCAGGWQKGTPSLTDIIRQWIAFNENLSSDSEIRKTKTKLVQFLYNYRQKEIPLHDWLQGIYVSCLKQTFEDELRLSDDKDKVENLINVTSQNKPLARLTVSSFAGQGRSPNHLNLTTLHSAKGLEFHAVIILGLEEGRIPWISDGAGALREKRRLFYVGITRAKYEVHLVYSGQYIDRRGCKQVHGPSRFVNEIKESIES